MQREASLDCDVEGIFSLTSQNNTFGGHLCAYLDNRYTVVKALLNGKPLDGDGAPLRFMDVGTRAQVDYVVGLDGNVKA